MAEGYSRLAWLISGETLPGGSPVLSVCLSTSPPRFAFGWIENLTGSVY